jgi:hypothetical protein
MTTISSPMVMLPVDAAPATRVRADRLLLWTCVVVALLSRIAFISVPFWSDAGIYIYMGKVVATGGRLYQDFFETKFPGVGLILAPLWMLFGSWWPGYVLTQTAMAFTSSWLLGRTMSRCVSEDAGRATLLFALVYLNFGPGVFTGFQLETVQIFFATIAGCLGIRWLSTREWWCAILIGLSAGLAGIVKPTGMAVLGGYGITMLWIARRDALKPLLYVALGAAVPIGLVLAWTIYANLLGEMPELLRQISLYGNQTPLLFSDLAKFTIVAAVLGFPMLVRLRIDRTQIASIDAPQGVLFFAVAWLLFECAGVVAQRRMYMYHFLPLAAPCAVLFGLIPRMRRPRPLIMALGPAIVLTLCFSAPLLAKLSDGFRRADLTEYLVAHTQPHDAIFCDWMPRVLLESDLRPGSRYPHLNYFGNYDTAALDYGRVVLSDFEQRGPVYIALPARMDAYITDALDQPQFQARPIRAKNTRVAWGQIAQYVDEHYQPEAVVDRWRIYRRK